MILLILNSDLVNNSTVWSSNLSLQLAVPSSPTCRRLFRDCGRSEPSEPSRGSRSPLTPTRTCTLVSGCFTLRLDQPVLRSLTPERLIFSPRSRAEAWFLFLTTSRWFALRLDAICSVFVTVTTFGCLILRDRKRTPLMNFSSGRHIISRLEDV